MRTRPTKIIRYFALIDVENYCFRLGHITKSRKLPIRLVIKWFLRDIQNLRHMLPEPLAGFAFCFDSRDPERKRFFLDYKSSRVRDSFYWHLRELIDQIRLDVLPKLGFKNVFYDEGYEADDQIAMCCANRRADDQHIICSNDQDYYQLLRHFAVSIWDPRTKKMRTQEWLEKKHSTGLNEWFMARVFSGDPGDNIPSVLGPVTALKYVKNILNHRAKTYKYAESPEARNLYNRNYALMKLPNPRLVERDRVLRSEPYDQKVWNSVCGKLGYLDLQDHSYVQPDSTNLEAATGRGMGGREG